MRVLLVYMVKIPHSPHKAGSLKVKHFLSNIREKSVRSESLPSHFKSNGEEYSYFITRKNTVFVCSLAMVYMSVEW